ncbi:MAG TPA: hypothetical protein VKR58_04160 [Aquella sp.]|nr:hypothetical protein [Aquella sp.]
MDNKSKMADLLLEKFVNEEIMTKSEFQLNIDKIMDRHEANIRSEFEAVRSEFEVVHSEFKAVRSEFGAALSDVRSEMRSMEARFDRQFLKNDVRYNWVVGIIVTSVIGIVGILFKIISMFSTIPQ